MRVLLRALGELLRGLLAFPERRHVPGRNYAAAVEERWAKPSRCC